MTKKRKRKIWVKDMKGQKVLESNAFLVRYVSITIVKIVRKALNLAQLRKQHVTVKNMGRSRPGLL